MISVRYDMVIPNGIGGRRLVDAVSDVVSSFVVVSVAYNGVIPCGGKEFFCGQKNAWEVNVHVSVVEFLGEGSGNEGLLTDVFPKQQSVQELSAIVPEESRDQLSGVSSLLSDCCLCSEATREPEIVCQVRECISSSESAVSLCSEGVGGTYFIHDGANEKIAIFKPVDEEPGAPNNPRTMVSPPLLPPGGGAKREVAAYLLDGGHAGVPETYFLDNVRHKSFSNGSDIECVPKTGSVQKFVTNIGDSSTMGTSRFSISDVHRIGILDLRLFNIDRNCENILIQKLPETPTNSNSATPYRLVPIDHTFILPPTLDNPWFEWQFWKQAREPFSAELVEYVRSIDVDRDAEILRGLGIEEEGIRTMMISSNFMKLAVEEAFNLNEIAGMVCRKKRKCRIWRRL